MNEARFVLDTNTLISAFIFRNSVPYKAVQKALKMGEVLLSLATLEELQSVLFRSKFDKYVSVETRRQLISDFISTAELVEITEKVIACRDPKDDKFLSLAVSGGATVIVSGDKDLLVLHPFRGIDIVKAADFLEEF